MPAPAEDRSNSAAMFVIMDWIVELSGVLPNGAVQSPMSCSAEETRSWLVQLLQREAARCSGQADTELRMEGKAAARSHPARQSIC